MAKFLVPISEACRCVWVGFHPQKNAAKNQGQLDAAQFALGRVDPWSLHNPFFVCFSQLMRGLEVCC